MPRRRRASVRKEGERAPGTGAAPGPAGRRGVLLAWALDGAGAKVRAAALRGADRRARAPYTCLGCGEVLVPHLGRVRAPHFAHAPGSRCPLTAPETALHLDAKERLLALAADAFAGRRRVVLAARCASCRRTDPRDLAAIGDAAEAEGAVGALRADVLVRAAGRPALAIEVKVTHAVDPGKEAALAASGVPAVEVDAREDWEREEADAVVVACARTLGFPPCAACAAQARADVERAKGGEAAEVAELEAYRARGLFGPPAGRPPAASAPDAPLTGAERAALARRFRCPECGGDAIAFGVRLAKHGCAGAPDRPVAWRGYDGALVVTTWWSR